MTLQLPKDRRGLSLPHTEDITLPPEWLEYWCIPGYSDKWKDLEIIHFDLPAQFLLDNYHK